MGKKITIFLLIVMVCHVITYFFAGIIAQVVMGVGQYYPPSPTALHYLRSTSDPAVQAWLLPAQLLRGLLFGLILFPFRTYLRKQGFWKGALLIMGVIYVIGYIAASGGLIEHKVFFTEYPAAFAVITLIEIAIQTFLLGVGVMYFDQRFLKSDTGTKSSDIAEVNAL